MAVLKGGLIGWLAGFGLLAGFGWLACWLQNAVAHAVVHAVAYAVSRLCPLRWLGRHPPRLASPGPVAVAANGSLTVFALALPPAGHLPRAPACPAAAAYHRPQQCWLGCLRNPGPCICSAAFGPCQPNLVASLQLPAARRAKPRCLNSQTLILQPTPASMPPHLTLYSKLHNIHVV